MEEKMSETDVLILAVESSCDETAAAVVKNGSIGAAAQELCFSGASVPARIGVREVVSHYATCR